MTSRNATNDAAETSGPKRFDLIKPYEFRGQRYDSFMAREPRVRDIRTFLKTVEADPILATYTTLAQLCGVDEPVMADLHTKDFGIMKQWFEGFLSDLTPDSQH